MAISVTPKAQAPAPPPFKPFNLALVQLGSITADKTKNLLHAREMILKAASGDDASSIPKPDVVVLPECFNSPYGHLHFPVYAEPIGYTPGKPYDVEKSPSESVRMLSSAAREAGIWLIGGSIPELDVTDNKVYNTCTVYSPTGHLVALHRKVHLFDVDIPGGIKFTESITLSAGNTLNFFDTDFARIGIGICYDVRFSDMAAVLARRGCHAIIYPAAFNMVTGPLHWELLSRARAIDNQIYFSMCSPARDTTAEYIPWGHSLVVDPMGKVVCQATENEEIVHIHIDPTTFNNARAGIPVTKHRRFDVYPDVSK